MARQPLDTIAALATAPGVGAVAIVRLSGSRARQISQSLSGVDPQPRYAHLCDLRDGAGELIDRGLLLYFPEPASYTGEDVVELQLHGGHAVTAAVLERAYALGARPAEPGEFTLRAFLNDKLDLLQAESIADLVASGSRRASQAALRSLGGVFSEAVQHLQRGLTDLRVNLEAWLDFPEEDLPFDAAPELRAKADALLVELDDLLARAREGRALRDGLSLAIVGAPNAGKSSLLNRLAGYDAAIVTDIPGTTRDPLREQLTLDGIPVTVVDTAGLRPATDPIEQEGVRRALAEIARADEVLWVVDRRDALERSIAHAHEALGVERSFTVVVNKIDLVGGQPKRGIQAGQVVIEISALTGEGLELLVSHLKTLAGMPTEVPGTFAARRRHLHGLERARLALIEARSEIDGGLELAAEHLRSAQLALSELTGEHTSDDLLGEIFASFCIGK